MVPTQMHSSLYTVHSAHTPDSLWTVDGILAVILKKLQTPPQHNSSRSGGVIRCKKVRLLRVKMSAYYKRNNFNLVLQNFLVIWSNCFEDYNLPASKPLSIWMFKHSKALAFCLPLTLSL